MYVFGKVKYSAIIPGVTMYSEISESLKGLGCCTAMYLEILEALKRALKKYFARFYSPSGVFPVRFW